MQTEIKTINICCRFCKGKTGSLEITDEKAVALNEISKMQGGVNQAKEYIKALTDDASLSESDRNDTIAANENAIRDIEARIVIVQERADGLEHVDEEKASAKLMSEVEDSRCESCQNKHGSYADMQYDALSKGISRESFISIMEKTGYTNNGFDDLLAEEVQKLVQSRQQPEIVLDGRQIDEDGCIGCE